MISEYVDRKCDFGFFPLEKEGTIEDAIERGQNKRGVKLSEMIAECDVSISIFSF